MDPQTLLVTTVARHFPEAQIAGDAVDLGFARLRCSLGAMRPFAGMQSAQLLFDVTSDELRGPIQLSLNAVGQTLEQAIVSGACGWTCSFGPVLRAGLSDDAVADVEAFVVMQNGTPYRVYTAAYDYVLHFEPTGGEPPEAARARVAAGPSLAFQVLGSGQIELADRPQLLSIFVGELPDRGMFEVKLDGVLQDQIGGRVAPPAPAPAAQMVALRELAIIVPD
jgi:hypothetical protein